MKTYIGKRLASPTREQRRRTRRIWADILLAVEMATLMGIGAALAELAGLLG